MTTPPLSLPNGLILFCKNILSLLRSHDSQCEHRPCRFFFWIDAGAPFPLWSMLSPEAELKPFFPSHRSVGDDLPLFFSQLTFSSFFARADSRPLSPSLSPSPLLTKQQAGFFDTRVGTRHSFFLAIPSLSLKR